MKIAMAVPVYDNPESMFFQSFTSALSFLYETKLQDADGNIIEKMVETFVCSGIIQEARHRLFFEALKWDADYIIWCDADHIFPVDAFPRLLAHNKDIVGCNYARRVNQGQKTAPTAAKLNRYDFNEKLCYTTQEKAEEGLLERVDHLGLGLTCMRMSVLERLTERAQAEGKPSFMPLFHWEDKDPGMGKGSIGEDVYFFEKCRKAGIDVWCDHALSWEVGHIAKRVLTHAHVERDKEQWLKDNAE
jgi:hypothetical protein